MNMRVSRYGGTDLWQPSTSISFSSHTHSSHFASPGTLASDPWDIDSGPPSSSPLKRLSRVGDMADGDTMDIGGMPSSLMTLLMHIINMLGLQDQNDTNPKVESKGKGKGCGSHPDAYGHHHSAHPKDPASHAKDRSRQASKDHETRTDENGPVSKSGKPTSKTNDPTSKSGSPTSKTSGPSSMPEPTGTVTVNKTIVVKAGEVFDGGGKLYKAGANLGDGSQSETQKPVFQIEPGGVLKNLQYEGADGIHTMGDATIQNVWNRDVGEDAMTMKKPGNVTWSGGGAFNADDKIFQLNAGGSFTLENFTADGFGKAIRTNGGKNIDTDIVVRNSHFENGKEAIVRTDATAATITLEGVTFRNVPNDVLAPDGTKVVGAVKRGSK